MNTSLKRLSLAAVSLILACGGSGPQENIGDALIFHASYDRQVDADLAGGDNTLYTQADADNPPVPGVDESAIVIQPEGGRFGGALQCVSALPAGRPVQYLARDNVAYSSSAWGGTVSYWLSLDPNKDLPRKFSDPIQLLERRYNDGAIWQDFTSDTPRDLRIGLFPDGPDNINTKDVPEEQQPVIRVTNPAWQRGEWHHVVITWNNINSGQADAVGVLYLDGRLAGSLEGKTLRYTWDPDRATINVGVNYVGLIDDLAIFNRMLTTDEVQVLHGLKNGVGELR